MPPEELSQKPGRLLAGSPIERVGGHDVGAGETLDERLDPGLGLCQVGRQLGGPSDWPRDLETGLLGELRSQGFEPIAQPEVADDVVAVVPLDAIEMRRRRPLSFAELEPFLEGDDARPGVAQVDLAGEVVERLHLLDRVALDRCPK